MSEAQNRRRHRLAGPAVGLALVLVACAPGSSSPRTAAPAPPAPPSGAAAPAPASSPNAPVPPARLPLKTAYTSVNAGLAPVWLAHDTGAFAEQGLDAELSFISAGQAILGALSTQEAPLVVAGANTIVEANLQGGEYVLLGSTNSILTQGIWVTPAIQRPDDLRGKTLGVSNFGAISHVALKVALAHWGLEEGRDVTVIRSGGTPETIAAMQTGTIQGGSFGPPQSFRARDLGFRELLDVATLRYEVGASAIASSRAYVAERADVVERYIKALIKGAYLFRTNRELGVEAIVQYGRIDDRATAEETWTYYRDLLNEDMLMPPGAIENILKLLVEHQPAAATAKPEQFLDARIAERIKASGYVEQVRRGQ